MKCVATNIHLIVRCSLISIALVTFFQLKSQVIIDSCFSSVDLDYLKKDCYPLCEPISEYVSGNRFWLAEWNNGKWVSLVKDKNHYTYKQTQLPSSVKYAKALYMGGTALGEDDEYIALKLTKKLAPNKEYSFTFTYSCTPEVGQTEAESEFSPIIRTNNKPTIKKSTQVDNLPKVGYDWETHTITFKTTKKQKNHSWIIIDNTDYNSFNGGFILDMCTKLLPEVTTIDTNNVLMIEKDDYKTINQLEKGESIILKDLLFETGESTLKEESYKELDKLVSLFQNNSTLKVEIQGHTDNTGNEAENLILSEQRAKSVVEYLISKGVSSFKLFYKGFGSSKPITTNETEESKAKNRRVELMIR